ncbi:SusD/RagB family nutrient-binding outer membrane lipoprotein [soil metagenome]
MKNIIIIFSSSILLMASACNKKFDDLSVNPNSPEKVPASLALNGVENGIYQERPWGLEQRWNQFSCCNYNYYGNQEYNWGGATLSYTTLKNVLKMEEEAIRAGGNEVNPYSALGKFFRAYLFFEMTMKVGDLPMNEALKGVENLTPEYDSQKQIFLQIMKWLEEANTDFTQLISKADNTLLGDFYYNNDMKKWQKAVNTFHLRVLVSLSKKEADDDLKSKQDCSKIISDKTNYPLMADMTDNLQFVFINPFNKYPTSPDNFGFDATRYNMASTYLGILTSLKDPRTFAVAEPAGSKLKAGMVPSDHAAYLGASSAEDLADMTTKAGVDNGPGFTPGTYSFYGRKRYYSTYTAESGIILGYAEMCFNIAEAINRGWSTTGGDTEDWYKKGIQASIGFYGIKDGDNTFYYLKAGGKVTESADYIPYNVNFIFANYYNQALVKYAGNTATGLEQILEQKYVAFFQNSGYQAYYNFRRTGIPAFAQNGPGTGNSGKIPKRFQYPGTERTTNANNLSEALNNQYGGNDDINAEMWVIK